MDRRKSIVLVQIAINILLVIALVLFPIHSENVYKWNYVVDLGCTLIVVILYSSYIRRCGFDIFDPLCLITFIYGFMYFITPMYDIITGSHSWFGYYLFPYGIKASLIALLGYISFYVFYSISLPRLKKVPVSERAIYKRKVGSDAVSSMTIAAIVAFYGLCFIANLFYLLHSGYGNILYILTMGLLGSGNKGIEQQGSIGFIAMFSYCLPTLVLLYWEYGKNKIITFVLFILMLMMQVTRGFRFFVIQIAIAFAAYYYITRKKRPKLRQLILLFLILMVPLLMMTIFRNSVRGGAGVSLSGIDGAAIKKALEDVVWDNFRIYNNFYGMVHAVPQNYGYVYGRQILAGTLIMVIPRAIWPNKISSKGGVGLDLIVGSRLAHTGQAYPGLGEYYYAFGVFGVIFFMAVYGAWMRHVRKKYKEKSADNLDTIVFSVLLASNLQLIIRGYTPSNFWYLVFSLLPVLMVRFLESSLPKRINEDFSGEKQSDLSGS